MGIGLPPGIFCPPPPYNTTASYGVLILLLLFLLPGIKGSRRDIGGWGLHQTLLEISANMDVDELPTIYQSLMKEDTLRVH